MSVVETALKTIKSKRVPASELDLTGICVLQVVPALNAGGVERTTLEIASAVVSAGGRAIVSSSGGRLEADLVRSGATHVTMPLESKNPLTIASNASRLKRLVEEEGAELVHARSRAPAWSAFIATRKSRAAFVTTYHGAYRAQNPFKGFVNSVMARGDIVIANSEFTAETVRALYPFGATKMIVIPRGADLKDFGAQAVDEDACLSAAKFLGWDDQTKTRVLLPARLTEWKGHKTAIRALSKLRDRSPAAIDGLVLSIIGDPQGRTAYVGGLKDMITNLNLSAHVVIRDHVTNMPAAYAASDLVLVPSERPEAFGRVAVEAAAAEKFVIASKCGALSETIVDGETGMLFAPADADDLASKLLISLRKTKAERAEICAKAKARAVSQYSLDAMISSTLRVYLHLAERHSSSDSNN
ncbi:MAG: glycosyltransferase family 4 protein [Pseudomonadota bacterium]